LILDSDPGSPPPLLTSQYESPSIVQRDLPLLSEDLLSDDIKTEYHPSSGRATEIHHFEDYRLYTDHEQSVPPTAEPWKPFQTRLDFEVAELALQAALTKEQIDTLLSLMHKCADGSDILTLTSSQELNETWNQASDLLTSVSSWPCLYSCGLI
jgi:hypothetical protein